VAIDVTDLPSRSVRNSLSLSLLRLTLSVQSRLDSLSVVFSLYNLSKFSLSLSYSLSHMDHRLLKSNSSSARQKSLRFVLCHICIFAFRQMPPSPVTSVPRLSTASSSSSSYTADGRLQLVTGTLLCHFRNLLFVKVAAICLTLLFLFI
jgi:hypothetical protein